MLNEIRHTRLTARAGGSAKSKRQKLVFAAKRQAVWLKMKLYQQILAIVEKEYGKVF